jgi:hypothetical protein
VAFALGECLLDHVAIAVELGELAEAGCFESVLRKPVGGALGRPVLVTGRAGVVAVAAAATVRARADVGAAAVVTAEQPGEQEVGWVAAAQRCLFAAAAQDLLGLLEGVVVDERLLEAGVGVAVPAAQSLVGRVGKDQLQGVG